MLSSILCISNISSEVFIESGPTQLLAFSFFSLPRLLFSMVKWRHFARNWWWASGGDRHRTSQKMHEASFMGSQNESKQNLFWFTSPFCIWDYEANRSVCKHLTILQCVVTLLQEVQASWMQAMLTWARTWHSLPDWAMQWKADQCDGVVVLLYYKYGVV